MDVLIDDMSSKKDMKKDREGQRRGAEDGIGSWHSEMGRWNG